MVKWTIFFLVFQCKQMQASASILYQCNVATSMCKVQWKSSSSPSYDASNIYYSFTQPIVIPNLDSNTMYNMRATHMDSYGNFKNVNVDKVAYLPIVRGKIGMMATAYNSCTFGNDAGMAPSSGITFGKVADVTPDRINVVQTACISNIVPTATIPCDYVQIYDASSIPSVYIYGTPSLDNGYVARIAILSDKRINLFTGYDSNGKLAWYTYILSPQNTSMPRVFDTCASRGGITLCAGSCGNMANTTMILHCNGVPYGTSNLMTATLSPPNAYSSFLIGLYSNGFPKYYLRSNANSIRVAEKPSDKSFYVALVATGSSMLYYGGADMYGNGKYSSMDVTLPNGIVLVNIIDGIPQASKVTIQATGCVLQALKTAIDGSIFISLTCTSPSPISANSVTVTDASSVPIVYTASSMTGQNSCVIIKLNANLTCAWCCFGQLKQDVAMTTVTSAVTNGTVLPSTQTNIPTIFTCLLDTTPSGNLVAVISPNGLYSTYSSSFVAGSTTTYTTAVTISASSLLLQVGYAAIPTTSTTITYVNGSSTPTFVHNMYLLRLNGVDGTIQTHTGFGQSDISSYNSVHYILRPLSMTCGGGEGFVVGWKQLEMKSNAPNMSYAYSYQSADGSSNVSTTYAVSNTQFGPGYGDKLYITAFMYDVNLVLKMAWESGFLSSYILFQTGEISVSFNATDSAYLISSWGGTYDYTGPKYYDTGSRSTNHLFALNANRYNWCDRLFLSVGLNGNIL
jgi:hypothetical protein